MNLGFDPYLSSFPQDLSWSTFVLLDFLNDLQISWLKNRKSDCQRPVSRRRWRDNATKNNTRTWNLE